MRSGKTRSAQLKEMLRSARQRHEPWYEWVLELSRRRAEGLPPVPPEDYDQAAML